MRKQTKLVAVLSAAALLAVGASMTSFAGWEKDEDGIWHYYDSDDEMVEDEWRKDGSKWFYLDEDGNMATDQWVDDDYYVGEDGAMLKNQWVKTLGEDEEGDPDEGEHWYYFGSNGKKVTDTDKKINGKTYYFNEDGKMYTGWYSDDKTDTAYYLGGEDEGWRAENQWLWLENPGSAYDEDEDDDTKGEEVLNCTDDESDPCDDEGWYWFGSDGKAYHDHGKKKINGRYYMFNEHGQMLYEWINDSEVRYPDAGSIATSTNASNSNAQLDGNVDPTNSAYVKDMFYYNVVEEGDRANGWYEIDGSEDAGTDGDTDWYYIDDGEPKRADGPWDVNGGAQEPTNSKTDFATYDDDGPVYVARIKVPSEKMGKVYFAFNEMGQMQDGLQYIAEDDAFYYFEEGTGYPQDGKIADVECDDDSYDFRFDTKSGNSGKGITGEKDNYLYYNGKRLEADDDYKFYVVEGNVYLVNNKGKIQKAKSGKVFDDDEMENPFFEGKYVYVKTSTDGIVDTVEIRDSKKKDSSVEKVDGVEQKFTADSLIYNQLTKLRDESKLGDSVKLDDTGVKKMLVETEGDYGEEYVAVPFIQLYDDDVYTTIYTSSADNEVDNKIANTWLQLNKPE